MSVKANGTDAKDIAIHFLNMTGIEVTPANMAKTIKQAKRILLKGYSKKEIKDSINMIVSKGVKMYSIGYVEASIDDILLELKKEEEKESYKSVHKELEELQLQRREAVTHDGESAKRNREKARRLGTKSRLREKFNFDMFEEQ